MAGEDMEKPPTQPRCRTPDHPPYAVMVSVAIQYLAEEGGSTMAAISNYIQSNYDDFLEGYDRLLPYYLGKLTTQGEFIMTAPSRFLVSDNAAAAPSGSLKATRNKGMGSTQSKPDAHEGDIVEPKSNANQVDDDVESLGYTLALPWEGPLVTVPMPVNKGGDGAQPVPKHCGHLQKVCLNKGGMAQDRNNNGKDQHNEPETTPTQGEKAGKDSFSSTPKHRGRGRPLKRKYGQ